MKRKATALLLSLVLVAAACGGGDSSNEDGGGTTKPTDGGSETTDGGSETSDPDSTTPPKASTVVIRPMYYREADGKGGLAEFTVSLAESSDNTLRVEFSEDEVIGMGDQYRASVWNAVTVATLLTGSPLKGTFRAEVDGYIDGPSAGMLTTVAVLALLRGDSLDPSVTMTGTVNPDGTVGPVGGIPEKIVGLADLGIKTVLIPTGQRNSPGHSDGGLVDVVQLGKDNGVTVQEVSDVYEAYKAFTGEDLPRLQGSAPRLDETTYQRLKAKADEALAKYDGAITMLASLDPSVTTYVTSLSDEAIATAERARSLETQGLQAGAFAKAWEAYAYAQAALSMAQNLQTLINQGVDAYFTGVLSRQAVTGETTALFDTLKTFTPESLTDASVLMQTYGAALDAYTVATSASNQLTNLQNAFANGEISLDDLAGAVIAPTAFLEIAGAMVEYAKAIFDVGRDLEGAPVNSDVDLAAVADFFRKASDANFAAFQTVVVKEYANQLGVSEDIMLQRFSNFDRNVELSINARNTLDGLTAYIGEGEKNAEYAQLGFAIVNFARNAGLVYKYYSNGQINADGQVTNARYDAALTAALRLGDSQLSAAIAQLLSNNTAAALQVAGYESGGIQREGTVDDKFGALTTFWEQYVSARVLAYLGGFEATGLS